jgi:hypothetical protein
MTVQKPIAAKGETCPFNGKDVSKVCHKCPLYSHVMGMDPQTGQQIDYWACSIALMPLLLIENSQQQRQTGAAVESFRNEMVKANSMGVAALISASMPRDTKLIEG